MKIFSLCCLAILLIATSAISASEVELKKSFWKGYQYSVDGGPFRSVGMSGNGLHDALEGNEPAQELMKKYKSRKTIATVTGVIGGFLIGWPAGAALADNYKDEYDTWLAVGIPISVISIGYEMAASSSLKGAVKEYNGGKTTVGFTLDYKRLASTDRDALVFGFNVRF